MCPVDEFLNTIKKERYSSSKGCSFLYVIRNPLNGLYKIGLTARCLKERLRILKNASGISQLELIMTFTLNCSGSKYYIRGLEKSVHLLFESQRIIGEWFLINESDLKTIDSKLQNHHLIKKINPNEFF